MKVPSNLTPVFLYGTLRRGGGLDRMLPQGARYGATIGGRLHYSPHTTGYPVLLPPRTAEDRVTGEVGLFSLSHRDVTDVVVMEIESGYCATWATVELDDGDLVDALTFTWHPHDGAGKRIDSGDWFQPNLFSCYECDKLHETRNAATECEWSHDTDDIDTAMSHALQKESR